MFPPTYQICNPYMVMCTHTHIHMHIHAYTSVTSCATWSLTVRSSSLCPVSIETEGRIATGGTRIEERIKCSGLPSSLSDHRRGQSSSGIYRTIDCIHPHSYEHMCMRGWHWHAREEWVQVRTSIHGDKDAGTCTPIYTGVHHVGAQKPWHNLDTKKVIHIPVHKYLMYSLRLHMHKCTSSPFQKVFA